ncbi:MAG: PAS domain-containing protein, partial [Gammaproteobacteria bacterium]
GDAAEYRAAAPAALIDRFHTGPLMLFRWRNTAGWPIERVSPNVETLLGYPATVLTARPMRPDDCIHPADLARVQLEVRTALARGIDQFEHQPYRMLGSRGRMCWVKEITACERDSAGTVTHLCGYVLEMTREFAQAQRSARLERLLAAIDQEVFLVAGDDQRLLLANASAVRATGHTVAELRQMALADLSADFAAQDFQTRLRALRDGHTPALTLDFAHRRKDGSVYPAEARVTFCAQEQPPAYVLTALDIGERKQAETALRVSEQRMTLALRGADLGLWDWNIATGEMALGAAWQRMLGYPPEQTPRHIDAYEELRHPEDTPWVEIQLHRHLRGETPAYETTYRMRHREGPWVWVLERGRGVERDARGRPARAAGTLHRVDRAPAAKAAG